MVDHGNSVRSRVSGRELRELVLDRETRAEVIRELTEKKISEFRGGKYVPGRANLSPQKREIIERLYILWEENPELRFGQLLGNLYPGDTQMYYTEDYELVANLEALYEHRKTL